MATPLRPLSTGELFDAIFSLYRKRFLLFVGVLAVANLLTLAFQVLQLLAWWPVQAWTPGGCAVTLLLYFVSLLTSTTATAATVVAVSRVYLGRPVSVTSSFGSVWRIIPRVTLITVGLALAIGGGFVLLIVPGVLVALMYALAVPVATLENASFRRAFSRSAELTRGFRGRILLVFLLYFVVSIVLGMIITLPIGIISALSVATGGNLDALRWTVLAQVVLSYISTCLVGPLLTIALSLTYYDLRVRKEAFDLQLLMNEIDEKGSGAGQVRTEGPHLGA